MAPPAAASGRTRFWRKRGKHSRGTRLRASREGSTFTAGGGGGSDGGGGDDDDDDDNGDGVFLDGGGFAA